MLSWAERTKDLPPGTQEPDSGTPRRQSESGQADRWTPGGPLRTGNSKCRESFFERQILESGPDLLDQTWLSRTYSSSGAASLEVSWTLDKGFRTGEAWMATPLLVDSTLGLEVTLGSRPRRLPASS